MKRRKWAVIDAETDPFKHGRVPFPFVWGYLDERGFETHWTKDSGAFVERLQAEDRIIFCHNGGHFDFWYLLPHAEDPCPLVVIDGRVVKMQLGRAQLRDSFACMTFGLGRYRKDSIDYSWFEAEEREAHRAEISSYLETDCRALAELCEAWIEEHGFRPITLAQAAWSRVRELEGLAPVRGHPVFDSRFRPFHFGGRCEALRPGVYREPIECWDIRSAYAWAMTLDHPWGFRTWQTGKLPTTPERLRRCFAIVQAASEGVLPVRVPSGGVSYPNTSGTFHATGWELEAGLEAGKLTIERVIACWEFPEARNFGSFVDHYWTKRQLAAREGDRRGELLAKAMLVSAYGKLAQGSGLGGKVLAYKGDTARKLRAKGGRARGRIRDRYLFDPPGPMPPYVYRNVATAASITGALRARLWLAKERSSVPSYLDTDSLFCRSLGPGERVGDGLGDWRKVATGSNLVAIGGRKLYAIRTAEGWHTASKGVRLSGPEIVRVCRGEAVHWESEVPSLMGPSPRFTRRTVRKTVPPSRGLK